MASLYPHNIRRAKAIAPSALFFFTCRVACSLDHIWLLSWRLGSHTSAAPRHGHGGPRPLHAVTPLYTAGHPRVRACHGPPGHLQIGSGRLEVPVAHSAQADSDPFPGHIPARLSPLGLLAEHSSRADSQRPVTSHDADHSNTDGTGIHPARARARSSGTNPIVRKSQAEDPAGKRRSTSQLLRQDLRWSTSQAADPGAQLHRA
jgi:hypothetical protein